MKSGTLEDKDIPIHRVSSLRESFLDAVEKWRYDGNLFARARGQFSGPFLMPILWQSVFDSGMIPSVEEACRLVENKRGDNTTDIVSIIAPLSCNTPHHSTEHHSTLHQGTSNYSCLPWVYQAHAGLIREIHVALYLSYFGTVTKNYYRDVFHGEDLHFRGRAIAIRHAGGFSDLVWSERKAEKSDGCIVLSSRGRGRGIHLVPLADIRAALGIYNTGLL